MRLRDSHRSEVVFALATSFEANADDVRAAGMKKYMRGQFDFYGLSSSVRRQLQSPIFNSIPLYTDPLPLAGELWREPQREFQHSACDLLRSSFGHKRLLQIDPHRALKSFESLITSKSWWDTVDSLAPRPVYELLTRYPGMDTGATCRRWIRSTNIWLQRSAIITQLKGKSLTDVSLLFELILHRADSDEFFVQKGSGWALREYSKHDPKAVREFIDANSNVLSKLTIREGGKYC